MSETQKSQNMVLIIHNVRSAANVGSMFRTADGAGVDAIWLSGYTPAPAKPHQKYQTKAEKSLAKAALGAEYFVPWKRSRFAGSVIAKLRGAGYQVIALEQDEASMPLETVLGEKPIALVVGNEVTGIHRRILKQCDMIGELPMRGEKNSLNVSVACGIALYTLRAIMNNETK